MLSGCLFMRLAHRDVDLYGYRARELIRALSLRRNFQLNLQSTDAAGRRKPLKMGDGSRYNRDTTRNCLLISSTALAMIH